MKTIENGKTSENLSFGCQDKLNNLWLLLHGFQKFAFSVKTIRLHDNDIIITISFSNLSPLWRPFSKVIVFSVFKSFQKLPLFLIVFV